MLTPLWLKLSHVGHREGSQFLVPGAGGTGSGGLLASSPYSKVSEVRRETVVREGGEDSQGCREQRDGARRCPSSVRILHLKATGYRGTKQ